jgi:hypothetical protein
MVLVEVATAVGPCSVVRIATGKRVVGSGIESMLGARFCSPVQTGPGAHPISV